MPRSIWKGSVAFGLVNIPVRLHPAVREHDVRFHQLAPDGSRIHYKRVSGKTGREVDYADIRKGYEVARGKFVTFEQDELEDLQPASTRTVDIEAFVDLKEIDPIYFDRTYHLAPDGASATKAYALLAAVMEDEQRVGIGMFVMREKQYLAAIRPYGRGLALTTMLFADEIVPQSEIGAIPSRRPPISKREREMASQIVRSLLKPWDPEEYHDTYEEQLRDIIRARAKGELVQPPAEEPAAEGRVLDLMDALQSSLGRAAKGKRAPAKRRAKTAATKRTKSTRTRATGRAASSRRTRRTA